MRFFTALVLFTLPLVGCESVASVQDSGSGLDAAQRDTAGDTFALTDGGQRDSGDHDAPLVADAPSADAGADSSIPDAGMSDTGFDVGAADAWPCTPAQLLCGGTCVEATYDRFNCGACGMVCPLGAPNRRPICHESRCATICDEGYDDCNGIGDDGCETVSSRDRNNCGACGRVCASDEQCRSGSCIPDDIP